MERNHQPSVYKLAVEGTAFVGDLDALTCEALAEQRQGGVRQRDRLHGYLRRYRTDSRIRRKCQSVTSLHPAALARSRIGSLKKIKDASLIGIGKPGKPGF
jgi:hypothetical protein